MLYEYKQYYKESASQYPGWSKKNKNELCFEYAHLSPGVDKDSCLSAIIYRFWYLPHSAYYSQATKIATEQDCYTWLITSILFVLKTQPWEDTNSSLYKAYTGPERAICKKFDNEKINFFVAAKRQKRYLNYSSISLNELEEGDHSDSYFTPTKDRNVVTKCYLDDMIISLFNKNDFVAAFAIDSILYSNFIDSEVENEKRVAKFNYKRLKHHLHYLDTNYCRYFSKRYNLNYDDVLYACNEITTLSTTRLSNKLTNLFRKMSQDTSLLEVLC